MRADCGNLESRAALPTCAWERLAGSHADGPAWIPVGYLQAVGAAAARATRAQPCWSTVTCQPASWQAALVASSCSRSRKRSCKQFLSCCGCRPESYCCCIADTAPRAGGCREQKTQRTCSLTTTKDPKLRNSSFPAPPCVHCTFSRPKHLLPFNKGALCDCRSKQLLHGLTLQTTVLQLLFN